MDIAETTDLVVTLVAPDALDPADAARVVEALQPFRADHAERLSPTATDIFCSGSVAAVRATTEATLGEARVDAIVQPREGRTKKLLLSDMDSTLIAQECIDELAAVQGIKDHVAGITERAMRGELDFEAALVERVALLAGTPAAAVENILRDTITLSPGGPAMVSALRNAGVRTVLVSGGFTVFAEPIAERLLMDAAFANRLSVADGSLTGTVERPILGADAKRERLLAECAALGISPADAVALGDGANDLAMIQTAGLGIAYRAKPAVAAAADAHIKHADLTAVAYALGLVAA